MAGGRPTTLGLHCGKVGPESSLGRDRRSEGANQAGRGLHDTAPSGPGPDPGQRWPHLGGARGCGQALSGPWPLTRSVPLLLSLLPRLHLLDAPTAKPRRAYPERWVPRCAHPSERARAHTHSAPEAMTRASPGRRLWRPAGNGYEGWQATDWAEAQLSWVGDKKRQQTRKRPPSRFLPEATGRWAGERRWLLISEGPAAATQKTSANAALRLSREEPNHRKDRCSHLNQSAPALGTDSRPPLPSNPRTRANQEIR